MRTPLLLTLLVLLSMDSAWAMPCQQSVCWQVAPTVCVAAHSGDQCALTVQLHWQADAASDVCALIEQQPIRCWSAQQSGQLEYQIKLESPVALQLSLDGEIKLEQQLSVLGRQPGRKKRLVAPWSVF